MTIKSNRIHQANELLESRNYAAAEAVFREALQDNPEHPRLLMMVGLCLRGQGRTDEGLAMLKQAAMTAKDDSEVHTYLARALLDQGNIEAARNSLKQCLSISPNDLHGRTLLGQIELYSGRPRAAADSLHAALRVDPDHLPALVGLARALIESGRAAEASKHAEKAVKDNPEDITAQMAMAQVFQALGHGGFAEQCLRNALELQPKSAQIWSALGSILVANGRHDDAVHALNKAVHHGSRTELTILALASSLHKLGRLQAAQQVIGPFIAEHPERAGPRAMLAEIYLDRQQPEQARALLTGLADEDAASVVLLKARLAETSGELDQAHDLASDLHDHDNTEIADKSRILSARIARARGAAVAARKALDPLIKAGRCEPQASWLLADIVAESGQLERAREILEKLINNEAHFSAITRTRTARRLALMLDRAGEFEQAGQFLQQPGWKTCHCLTRILNDSPAALQQGYQAIDSLDLDQRAIDDGRPQPVFILGWPGSGRDLLLRALTDHCSLAMLDRTTGQRRRDALGLPLNPAQLANVDDGRLRIGRKRFFSELRGSEVGSAVIDPSWWEATSLPALGRFFPGARVILPRAESAAQELHWMMAGFTNIDQMLAAKNADETLLAHLRPLLPLHFIDIELTELIDHPTDSLDRLGQQLGTDFDSETHLKLKAAVAESAYESARHWHHYGKQLLSDTPQR